MRCTTHRLIRIVLLVTSLAAALPAAASSFVYRGSLSDGGEPAEGQYGFRLTYYDAQFGGAALAPATTLDAVTVRNGLFNTELELDPALQARGALWLQVEVRDASGGFVPLAERDQVRPKALAVGVCWDTQGNAATAGEFLGTTNSTPLELRVNGLRQLRIDPQVAGSNALHVAPNMIAGGTTNATVGAGIVGATIAGGGGTINGNGGANTVAADWGSVGGGRGNQVAGEAAVIGGGSSNSTNGSNAVVAGGDSNSALSYGAVAAGGIANSATEQAATAAGGIFNVAGGSFSFAGGHYAQARTRTQTGESGCIPTCGDEGTFVWADAADYLAPVPFVSTGPNQFLIRASAGFGLNTTPKAANAEMTIMGSDNNVDVNLFPKNATFGYGLVATGTNQTDTHFYITQTNETTVFTQRLEIDPSGRVGLGRTPTANLLEVEGNASKTTATGWLANSDVRIKRDIAPVDHALDTLLRLRPVSFRYNDDYRAAHPSIRDQRYYNVVAQEFAEVFPDAVQSSGELLPGAKAVRENEILQVDVHPALITTIAAAQELAVKADAQASRIERLETENTHLRIRLDRLDRLLGVRARADN